MIPVKRELLSRILVSSSVFILGSPLITQVFVSIPAAAETITTSPTEETTLSTNELVPEQQSVTAEQAVVEETVDSETQIEKSAEEQALAESSTANDSQSESSAEQIVEPSTEAEVTESGTTSDEELKIKAAESDNILWSGNWGTASATLDIEGVLTVGAGTLSTTVDQVIPLDDSLKNMVIKKVVLTAPVILPANVPGLFESTSHYGKVPSELDEIVGLTYLDTSQATTMNSMFYGFRGTTLDLSNFDSSGVISSLGAGMNQFLADVWYLKELKLGPNFSFVGWNNWSSNPYPVNLVDPSGMYGFHSSYYTGYWQNVGTGTVEAPYGENILKSQELVLTYDGATMADTYVWQPRFIEGAPVTINYLDEDGQELLPPNVLTGGNIGDSIEVVPEDIPNYTLKEVQGEEKIIFSNIPQTVTYIYSPLIETREERKIVARIIHYLHEDGMEAAPDHVDTVEFIREVITNLATGEETLGEWQARDDDTTFDLVKSPEIDDYFTDREFIDEVMDVKADSEDIEEFVMYSPKIVESTETKEVKRMIHYVYEDGKEGGVLQTKSNDANGKIYFDAINYDQAGTYKYTIREVAGTDNTITYDDTVYHVTVNVEDQAGQLVASPAYQESIIFKNTYVSPKLGKVTLKKVDSETGKLLANAEFELQDSKGNIVQKKIVTNKDGKVEISNLDIGEYQLVETKAPDGYQIDKTPIKFSINDRSIKATREKVLEKENKRIKKSNSDALPKTGETVDQRYILVGLFCIICFIFLIILKNKKVKKQS